jgi:pyruvate,water dikinase
MSKSKKNILWFKEISIKDVPLVGGKNASLGEMFSSLSRKGINVPNGFATTSQFYRTFLKENKLLPKLKEAFKGLDSRDIKSLQEAGRKARQLISESEFSKDLKKQILKSYKKLSEFYQVEEADVAVRSSATAEDLPSASFAGVHESFLNVKGEEEVLKAVKDCFVSLFNDRAISYREEKGFDHFKIALSAGIQKMVRSDLGCAGVMFSLDTETGFKDVVLINGSWGLGETVVKGRVVTDEFMVFKPTLEQGFKPIISKKMGSKKEKLIYSKDKGKKTVNVKTSLEEQNKFILSENELLKLAQWAVSIEKHYKLAQDIEWAKDGKTREIYVVQSRPETIHSLEEARSYAQYSLKGKGKLLLEGEAIGSKIAFGKVRIIPDASRIKDFRPGEVLVTRNTDPDWEPIMKVAKAIITEQGSRVCHAAIVSRELGIPAAVGVKQAMKVLKNGQTVTLDCSEAQKAKIWDKELDFEIKKYDLKKIPKTRTKMMINTSNPGSAFRNSFLPNDGVGLAREEFIIASQIKIHPLALYDFEKLKDKSLKKKIAEITAGYKNKKQYYVDNLSWGIARIAAAFYPKPVIVRFSDFKSNEYARLLGGDLYEPKEENPMIGFRGASRYYDESFEPAFNLECQAIRKVREEYGLKNLKAMVPFCRTPEEGRKVLELIEKSGLKKGKDGFEIYMMCEIPSNVVLAKEFLEIFDGMSIGSNDLTQLVLGLDRDSALISKVGDERNPAVKEMIKQVISVCRKNKKYVGICGEAPSTFPEFAEFLVENRIYSMSLSVDAIIKTILAVSKKEKGQINK